MKLEQAAQQAFETWWEREGQEFLFALNTTTDDDIKLVSEIAWKNGAYCAEQAEQEPVAWSVFNPRTGKHWYTNESAYTARLYASEYSDNALLMEVKPLYAAPVRTKDLTDDEIAQACGWEFGQPLYEWVIGLARAVIAADREKNK